MTANRTAALLAGIALCGTVAALAIADPPPLEGTARVIDGDTIQVNTTRIRLWGIDAFEHAQTCEHNGTYACGRAATQTMEELVRNQHVRCVQKDIDRYKRVVAQCFIGSTRWGEASTTDIGRAMVLRGWAFDYTRYSGGAYKDVENGAREAKSGAWAGTFQWPWDYRHSGAK